MPRWNPHLILSALLWPPFSNVAVDRPSDDVIGQKWQTLKTTLLLLLPTARRISYLHVSCASTCLFTCWDVQNQSVVNLLPHAGFLPKNQMPDQALQWIGIPGIIHLNPDEPERILCWKSDVNTYLVCRCGYARDQWRVFVPHVPHCTHVLRTYYGDIRALSQY